MGHVVDGRLVWPLNVRRAPQGQMGALVAENVGYDYRGEFGAHTNARSQFANRGFE